MTANGPHPPSRPPRASAIITVKRFDAAKGRLEGALTPPERAALAEAMYADTLAAVSESRMVERILVVTGEERAVPLARSHQAGVIPDRHDRGQSKAAELGITRALELGAPFVALLPGDCPLLDPHELDSSLGAMSANHVTIVPDRHGTGTNCLLLSPPDAIRPAFGPGSRARHEKLAREAGLPGLVAPLRSLALDLDTPADLADLRPALDAEPSRAPRTARVVGELRIAA